MTAQQWAWLWKQWVGQMTDFKLASELKGSERSQALCDNKIDAFVYVVGHPNGSIKEATTSCDAKLISATGPKIDEDRF